MNIEQLKILITVAKSGSINEAAKKLHKTQPALSMAIKRLEKDIGFELFDRKHYRLELNERGSIFYQRSQNILAELEQLKSLSKAMNRGEEHELVINIEGPAILPQVFESFKLVQQKYPQTQLHIQTVKLLHGLKKLLDENADLTITPWIDAFNLEDLYETKPITTLAFTFCIHKQLAQRYNITSPNQINTSILQNIPQLSPTEMAFNLSNTPLLKKISHSIVQVDDIHCYIEALKSQLGWGPVLTSMLPNNIIDDFLLFDIELEENRLNIEVRVAKAKNKILGPVAQYLWDNL